MKNMQMNDEYLRMAGNLIASDGIKVGRNKKGSKKWEILYDNEWDYITYDELANLINFIEMNKKDYNIKIYIKRYNQKPLIYLLTAKEKIGFKNL